MVCSRGQYEAKLSKRIRGNITKITGGRKEAHIGTALLLCTVQSVSYTHLATSEYVFAIVFQTTIILLFI